MADAASLSGDTTTGYEEYDISSYDLTESTWNTEETNNFRCPRGTGAYIHTPQTTSEPVRILIIGPAGPGKTYAIKDSCCSTKEPMAGGPYEATKRVKATRLRYKEQIFELIDTPGFDNVCMSDAEVFSEIAGHLLNPKLSRRA
ncbi:hypothetical protein B0J17DRAFT_445194 [Rhizoctonia solani]|nr:hypothetical protein B0J17DRAFT_445194 [Rhizoctonia solani]